MRMSTKDDLQCKHCGHVKERLDLYCYFAWEDGVWSDQRETAPNVRYLHLCNIAQSVTDSIILRQREYI